MSCFNCLCQHGIIFQRTCTFKNKNSAHLHSWCPSPVKLLFNTTLLLIAEGTNWSWAVRVTQYVCLTQTQKTSIKSSILLHQTLPSFSNLLHGNGFSFAVRSDCPTTEFLFVIRYKSHDEKLSIHSLCPCHLTSPIKCLSDVCIAVIFQHSLCKCLYHTVV